MLETDSIKLINPICKENIVWGICLDFFQLNEKEEELLLITFEIPPFFLDWQTLQWDDPYSKQEMLQSILAALSPTN